MCTTPTRAGSPACSHSTPPTSCSPPVRSARPRSGWPATARCCRSRRTPVGPPSPGSPLTGLVDARKALALFGDGATVVFQGLHRYWQPIGDLVASLELELGHPCQANAYLTPPGAQGFAVHSDSHDVFVFQTHGSKQWEIHADDGVDDVLMLPGMSVYLPTGTPHAARAQEEVSLHVTIGINQLTWRGLVERSLRPLLDEVDDGHLPAGYLDDTTELTAGLVARLTGLAEAVRRVDVDAATAGEVDRFLTGRNPRLRGGLTRRTRSAAPRPTARSCGAGPATRACCATRGIGWSCSSATGAWRCRPGCARAMEVVRPQDELRPADLAALGLDESSRLVLCRRLVREGCSRPAVDRTLPLRGAEPLSRRRARRHRIDRPRLPAAWRTRVRGAPTPLRDNRLPGTGQDRAEPFRRGRGVSVLLDPPARRAAPRRASRVRGVRRPGRPVGRDACSPTVRRTCSPSTSRPSGRTLAWVWRVTRLAALRVHPRPARRLLCPARPPGCLGAERGAPGETWECLAPRRRPLRGQCAGAPRRALLRPSGRGLLAHGHRCAHRGSPRPGPPARPVGPADGGPGRGDRAAPQLAETGRDTVRFVGRQMRDPVPVSCPGQRRALRRRRQVYDVEVRRRSVRTRTGSPAT